ncbi:type I toxin-antitoxin system Hok family toxin [Enterobacter cloacae complex sp. P3B]|nr:type I toxin-antitoxin system Hok family toxin [Enterobacter cloacae complex sp. P26RS]MBE3436101.1 type I toxin-antitoxin system Hok family toxin [Enterobacter cloacae complex sp. P21RS]MBE3461672.1 type I toxin-antitoxin system Hok family toxin [Enterobacter cloacae complex sp. P21C]MBE3497255.1 type I toxin-antitoxin system Hok family toxin [Enterobacter cloacae complex sp. P2B]MBE3504927.1 type I toxin-antitoxin system Hok family toxin [Enterobacter cloacae complex sp. I11]MBE3518365.1 
MTPLKTALGIVFIICLTIVIFTFITRGRLCEFSIKSEHQEVAAKLACVPGLPLRAKPRFRPACRMLRS